MTKTNSNAQASQAFDPASLFPGFTMPTFDVDALASTQRRNVEALTEAGKLATDGVKAFTALQTEFLKNAADTYADAMRSLMSVNDPQAGMAKQAELAKTTFETSNANVRELTAIATKAQTESLDVINKRVVESMDELQAIAAKG